MGNFLQSVGQKLLNFFQPPQKNQSYQPQKPEGPGFSDPYVQNLATQNALNNLQNQIEPQLAPTRAILAYTQAHQPQIGPPAPSYAQSQTGQNIGAPAQEETGSKQVQYESPKKTIDPLQLLSMAGMVRNLYSQGQQVPQEIYGISTTPYTQAASQIGKSRQNLEQAILPSGYLGGSSMI